MNEFQKNLAMEWLEGVRKDSSPQGKRRLRKALAQKYELTMEIIAAIVRFVATQGMKRVKIESTYKSGCKWEPVDYVELIGDLKERVADLEHKFEYLIEGVETVLEDGQTFAIHLQHLHTIGKRMGIRRAIRANKPPLIELRK